MRVLKLMVVAIAALLLASASASALTVKKRIEAPGLPAQIWDIVGGFCAIKVWHPEVTDCVEEKSDGVVRVLTLKDGGKIKEKLTGTQDLAYTYEIIESPFPVKNYKAKLWLELDDEPDRSVIYWQADFDANGASDADAKAKIVTVLGDGVKGIKKQALAAHDAREAAAGNAPKADDDDDDDDDDGK